MPGKKPLSGWTLAEAPPRAIDSTKKEVALAYGGQHHLLVVFFFRFSGRRRRWMNTPPRSEAQFDCYVEVVGFFF